MKILIVTPYFFPMVGGLESYVFHVSTRLAQQKGYEVVIVTSNHLRSTDTIEDVHGLKTYRLSYSLRLSNTPVGFLWLFKLFRIFKKEQPDVIFAHTPVPYISDVSSFLSWWLKIPFTLTYHAGNLKKNQWLADAIVSVYTTFVEVFMLRRADALIALNQFVKQITLAKYADKVTLIPPGITLPTPKKPATVKNPGQKILFVGKLDKTHDWKGLKYLLQAFADVIKKHPKATLTIVGGGDHMAYYQELCHSLHITNHVKFIGHVTQAHVSQYYEQNDILVLPSTSSAESLGFVLLEAMTFGLPVVASRIGGIPHLIEDRVNGFLTEPKDVRAIAKAIHTLLENPDIFSSISSENLQTAQKYTWPNHIQQLMTIFDVVTRS